MTRCKELLHISHLRRNELQLLHPLWSESEHHVPIGNSLPVLHRANPSVRHVRTNQHQLPNLERPDITTHSESTRSSLDQVDLVLGMHVPLPRTVGVVLTAPVTGARRIPGNDLTPRALTEQPIGLSRHILILFHTALLTSCLTARTAIQIVSAQRDLLPRSGQARGYVGVCRYDVHRSSGTPPRRPHQEGDQQ